MRVPCGAAAGSGACFSPPSTNIDQAVSACAVLEISVMRATDAIDGSASPLNPRKRISNKSSEGSLDVAKRSTAKVISSGVMPLPLSVTVNAALPPSFKTTSILVAPASKAFSTNSFTADAGRSSTSPAAMRLTNVGGKRRRFVIWLHRLAHASGGVNQTVCR